MAALGRTADGKRKIVRLAAALLFITAEIVAFLFIPGNAWVKAILALMPALMFLLLGEALLWVGERGEQVRDLNAQLSDRQRRLEALLSLTAHLAEIEDEERLVALVLDTLIDITGARGSSFVPLDEWGQPLAAVCRGDVPEQERQVWGNYLASEAVRQRCKECEVRRAPVTSSCPLRDNPFRPEVVEIYCLPIQHGERILGMVNLYLPKDIQVDSEEQSFLEGLLNQMALAMETVRLRHHELMTLRQLQAARSSRTELTPMLAHLLEDVQAALEADSAVLTLRGAEKFQPEITLRRGEAGLIELPSSQHALETAVHTGEVVLLQDVTGGSMRPAILAVPILLPGQIPIGGLLVGRKRALPFDSRQARVLQTVANQAALLVENEHLQVELEYKAIMDERTRLAREIHDGLAQTLAFMKLQMAQMQGYLARGDLAHLREAMDTNYRTVSEAYLEVRQTIDYLRITPQNGLTHWLEQTAVEFMENSGLSVHLDLQPPTFEVAVEVQLQLIRIVQEALNNIRKHAHARQVWITLHPWNRDLILEVRDDGQGFSPEDTPELSQYGLRGMRERSELIGADFQIISQPSSGTTVRLRLPYPLEETTA
jgi:two-component system nitrate/nitrite sensor histidine kinase NarX